MIKKKKIVIKSNNEIKFKKYYEDELGISNFYGNIIEPYYNYDIYDDKIKINIELPGIINKLSCKTNSFKWKLCFHLYWKL